MSKFTRNDLIFTDLSISNKSTESTMQLLKRDINSSVRINKAVIKQNRYGMRISILKLPLSICLKDLASLIRQEI